MTYYLLTSKPALLMLQSVAMFLFENFLNIEDTFFYLKTFSIVTIVSTYYVTNWYNFLSLWINPIVNFLTEKIDSYILWNKELKLVY